ncbi:MAG: hypothetical protein OXU64_03025 [Gemmatimonadota bacterium]|nr:hypothetical protein [Deltaproteobacteria bacterium]MDE2973686.1 hypothetical protein [Gemmatimonadota bacterium]
MDSETPFWKKVVPKPSGTIPGGLFSQVAIGLTAVMIGTMLLSYQWCGGGKPDPAGPAQTQEPVAGGAGVSNRLSGLTEDQRERMAREQAEQRRRTGQPQQDALAVRIAQGTVAILGEDSPTSGTGRSGYGPAGGGPQFQTEAEVELRERLRLEDIERRRRSLRSGPVVLTHRTGGGETSGESAPDVPAEAERAAASDPQAAVRDALASYQSTLEMLAGVDQQAMPPEAPVAPGPPPAPAGADGPDGNYADPTRIAGPSDPPGWERIHEGSFLEGVLVTQLSGEFTGPVLALVAVPFYSPDRQRILVPRGTRAIGSAQAVGHRDQARLAVGFHRLVFPDGRWVELKFDGLDQAGDAALKDKVNRHYLSMFAAVGAVGVLSGLTLRGSHPYAGGEAGFRAGAGQSIAQSGMQILSRFLNRHPTITIRAGHRLRIWFTSDVLVPRPPP